MQTLPKLALMRTLHCSGKVCKVLLHSQENIEKNKFKKYAKRPPQVDATSWKLVKKLIPRSENITIT